MDKKVIQDQIIDLIKEYKDLILYCNENKAIISGLINFEAKYDDIIIKDKYYIEIILDDKYPNTIPIVKEIGGRIPSTFHKNGNDILCLEVESKMKDYLIKNPNLLSFVNKFLVEYLYGYSYKELYGRLPFGERKHGVLGIIDYYREIFDVYDIKNIIEFLKILAKVNYRGHCICPCGSGKKLRDCHGNIIRELISIEMSKQYDEDLKEIYKIKRGR
ncbi:YecA family protein [Clostridium saccharoperbutylacetonicum]|uniref:YecA family protein n=1 Tax=Clostridium saccharoperbutylacetonicum TaxID=36745 RepID=UPI000983B0CD|nr:SEC-C domain-containing protein [Clostridium saccharoperbutylacetonicum]AQR96487.1 SEC-C motif protein [Clostridium saccharoperbutylacetonicum]NSB32361.1 hypothetical protein [Clostridium saccharoperbutylacetonicum]